MSSTTTVDEVFRALADGTRRSVITRLTERPASVSELARPFDMALPSFVQHLRVLESSGLARSAKTGRVRTYQLEAASLQIAEQWLAAQRDVWERRMDRFERYVIGMDVQA